MKLKFQIRYPTTFCGTIGGVVAALNYQGYQRFAVVSLTVLTNQQKRAIDRLNQLGEEGLAAVILILQELSQSKNPAVENQANELLRQLRIPDKGSDPLDALSKRQTMNQDNEPE